MNEDNPPLVLPNGYVYSRKVSACPLPCCLYDWVVIILSDMIANLSLTDILTGCGFYIMIWDSTGC
jgi:hypothetical protein